MGLFTSAAKHALALIGLAVVGLLAFAAGDVVVDGVNEPGETRDTIYESIFTWSVGDLFGVIVFTGLLGVGIVLAWIVFAARDTLGLPAEPDVEVPISSPVIWPAVTALGAGLVVVGLVVNTQLAVLGFIVLGIAVLEWIVVAWTDRHSPSPERNETMRDRLMLPLEIPTFTVLLGAVPVFMLSRVFLASSKTGAALIATALAIVVLAAFFVLYFKPDLARGLVAGASVVAALGLIVGGIVSAAIGQREFEIHVGDHHGEEEEHDDEGAEEEPEESLGVVVGLRDAGLT
ncbi:MAG: hypothetical protein AAGA17_13740 [Actinomycetota bacterium]